MAGKLDIQFFQFKLDSNLNWKNWIPVKLELGKLDIQFKLDPSFKLENCHSSGPIQFLIQFPVLKLRTGGSRVRTVFPS